MIVDTIIINRPIVLPGPKHGLPKDNIYIDMQAGRNLLPKLLVADT